MANDEALLVQGGFGDPATPKWPKVVVLVLVTEMCERLAYYGFSGSLQDFFPKLGFSGVTSNEMVQLFQSIVYLTPVLGAYVADVLLGRFKTIIIFCIIYMAGLAMCTISAWPNTHNEKGSVDYDGFDGHRIPKDLALVLAMIGLFAGVAVGAGGIKSNVVVLGADQFKMPEQAEQQAAYFNFFYWAINIGATISYAFVANIALNGIGAIPKSFGFFTSFCIPLVAFTVAVVSFVLGKPYYRMLPPSGSAVTSFVKTVRKYWSTGLGKALAVGFPIACAAYFIVVTSFFLDGKAAEAFSYVGLAFIISSLLLMGVAGQKSDWLLTAPGNMPPTPDQDDAQAIVRLLPVAGCIVFFWLIYGQMSSSFFAQGCQMNLNVFGYQLSPALLNLFDSVTIMILVPVIDRIYAYLKTKGIVFSLMLKIGIGLCCAGAAVIVAGFVEKARRDAPLLTGDDAESPCSGSTTMSDISIWWQIPQYALIGLGEIFAAITCYELFYSEVPVRVRSVCQAINLLCTSYGSLMGGGIASAFRTWLPDNLNDGHLDSFFFVLAALMAGNVAVFIVVARAFQPRTFEDPDEKAGS